jgi:hypothetical protein
MLDSVRNGTPGFGFRFDTPVDRVDIGLETSNMATIKFPLQNGISVSLSVCVGKNGELVQTAIVSSVATSTVRIDYTLGLEISINRASYGQLTEGGPIPIPESENQLEIQDKGTFFSIVNPHLGAHLEGCLEAGGKIVVLDSLQSQVVHDQPIHANFSHWLDIPPHSQITIVARFRLFPDTEIRGDFEPLPRDIRPATGPRLVWKNKATLETFIIRRNLEYILGCLAIPVSDGHVALMADNVALPLGWNRDN